MKGPTAIRLGCAFLIGVALAFPAGLMLAPRPQPDRAPAASAGARSPGLSNPYSPTIAHDPYVVEQQRKGVEALERSCRETGQYCAEAAQLRQALPESGAGR
jgi:hypothetical protein